MGLFRPLGKFLSGIARESGCADDGKAPGSAPGIRRVWRQARTPGKPRTPLPALPVHPLPVRNRMPRTVQITGVCRKRPAPKISTANASITNIGLRSRYA